METWNGLAVQSLGEVDGVADRLPGLAGEPGMKSPWTVRRGSCNPWRRRGHVRRWRPSDVLEDLRVAGLEAYDDRRQPDSFMALRVSYSVVTREVQTR